MSDLISRQAAIEALRTCYDTETITMDNGDEYINYGDAVGEIEQLPPIQSKLLQPWEVLVAQAVLPFLQLCREERGDNMNIDLEKDIVQSLSSLYPLQEFEERAIDTVLDAIPHWIPVTERLPEINEDILLSYFDEVTIGWLCGDGSWMIFDGQECASADEISAWMLLPEPFKGVTE